jgi:hypothetical protein
MRAFQAAADVGSTAMIEIPSIHFAPSAALRQFFA